MRETKWTAKAEVASRILVQDVRRTTSDVGGLGGIASSPAGPVLLGSALLAVIIAVLIFVSKCVSRRRLLPAVARREVAAERAEDGLTRVSFSVIL